MSDELPNFELTSRPRPVGPDQPVDGLLSREASGMHLPTSPTASGMNFPTSPLSKLRRQADLNIYVPEVIDLVSSSDEELIIRPKKAKSHAHLARSDSRKRLPSASPERTRVTAKRICLQGGSASLDVFNDVDDTELPKNFCFINDYVFREGTSRLPLEARTGCSCKENQGRNVGCEYVQKCECLQDAVTENGRIIGFPYHAEGAHPGCLQTKYLKTRYVIYECNDLCGCGPDCRNKVVSRGRKIPLEIFRTSNSRGWGLRCPKPIMKGQFIDTYRGEVITSAEADRREEESSSRTKDSFLFSLDKFEDEEQYKGMFGEDAECFVVDGEFMGGPARFVNHSCDPNCDVFAVSNVRGDYRFYYLALFALEDIPAGTELTFDYIGDQEELVASHGADDEAKAVRNGKLATKCLCGSKECRGYLWL